MSFIKRYELLLLFLLATLGVALIWRGLSRPHGSQDQAVSVRHPKNSLCSSRSETMEMPDVLMAGIIEKGAQLTVYPEWYQCNLIKRGDIVLIKVPGATAPVVKIVRAISGDRFHVFQHRPTNSWSIEINGAQLLYQGKPYFFGDEAYNPVLADSEKSHNQVLGEKELIVFSARPPGFQDSANFGIITTESVLGRVEPSVVKE